MVIRKVIGSCPNCTVDNCFGNIYVADNYLTQGCERCGFTKKISLPLLNKYVIYLDQSFFSHAFRCNIHEFKFAENILREMIANQLIVCPYSEIHQIETYNWNDSKAKELWKFIISIASGHEFKTCTDIKIAQLKRAYNAFQEKKKFKNKLHSEALDKDINDWCSYDYVEIISNPYNNDLINKYKNEVITKLIQIKKEWQNTNASLEVDVALEVRALATELVNSFTQYISNICSGHSLTNIPEESSIFNSLLEVNLLDVSKLNNNVINKSSSICEFLKSDYFGTVQYVLLNAYLVAQFKQEVRSGWLQNDKNAKKQFRGLYFDVEHISIFAPYCDVIFVDNKMRQILNKLPDKALNKRHTKVFSADCIDDFIKLLDLIKHKNLPKIEQYVRLVY